MRLLLSCEKARLSDGDSLRRKESSDDDIYACEFTIALFQRI